MLSYLSPEWIEEFQRRVSALPATKMRGVSATLSLRHQNAPGGGEKYLYIALRNGALQGVQAGAGMGPAAEFVILGDYAVFAQVLSGRLEAGRALSSGRLKLKGNMLRAMGLTPAIEAIIFAAQGVPHRVLTRGAKMLGPRAERAVPWYNKVKD